MLAMTLGDSARTVRLYSAATALRYVLGAPLPPIDHERYAGVLAAARGRLDAETYDLGIIEGRRWTVEKAVEESLAVLQAVRDAHGRPA